jgi:hypothetical protein
MPIELASEEPLDTFVHRKVEGVKERSAKCADRVTSKNALDSLKLKCPMNCGKSVRVDFMPALEMKAY